MLPFSAPIIMPLRLASRERAVVGVDGCLAAYGGVLLGDVVRSADLPRRTVDVRKAADAGRDDEVGVVFALAFTTGRR